MKELSKVEMQEINGGWFITTSSIKSLLDYLRKKTKPIFPLKPIKPGLQEDGSYIA